MIYFIKLNNEWYYLIKGTYWLMKFSFWHQGQKIYIKWVKNETHNIWVKNATVQINCKNITWISFSNFLILVKNHVKMQLRNVKQKLCLVWLGYFYPHMSHLSPRRRHERRDIQLLWKELLFKKIKRLKKRNVQKVSQFYPT